MAYKSRKHSIGDEEGDFVDVTKDGKLRIEGNTQSHFVFEQILDQLKIISLKLNVLSDENPDIDESSIDGN